MTDLHALIGFAIAAGLLTITPGLDTALVLRTAAMEGTARAMMAATGIAAGCLCWAIAASVGLGALVAASRLAYDILRFAGGAYVIWLGGRMVWNAIARKPADLDIATVPAKAGARSWLMRGFLTNILNPKVGVFYVSLLPLFIPPDANVMAFSLVLATIHVTEGLVWFWLLTSAMKPLAKWIVRGGVARWFDGIAGGVLIAFGGALLLERR